MGKYDARREPLCEYRHCGPSGRQRPEGKKAMTAQMRIRIGDGVWWTVCESCAGHLTNTRLAGQSVEKQWGVKTTKIPRKRRKRER